jgi:hypothetical protein
VQGKLGKFQKIYPDWNLRIVNFRLNYLPEKITEVTAKLSVVLQSGMLPGTVPAPPDTAGRMPAFTNGGQCNAHIWSRGAV